MLYFFPSYFPPSLSLFLPSFLLSSLLLHRWDMYKILEVMSIWWQWWIFSAFYFFILSCIIGQKWNLIMLFINILWVFVAIIFVLTFFGLRDWVILCLCFFLTSFLAFKHVTQDPWLSFINCSFLTFLRDTAVWRTSSGYFLAFPILMNLDNFF